jgi:hypothetical protein
MSGHPLSSGPAALRSAMISTNAADGIDICRDETQKIDVPYRPRHAR